ncbi:interleukin-31 receptor subunit alpha [Archocentrus centrarchus]|uniref:interleukin-31 receptor subunit alpha n=1 Tax=Archocentrus centrarchus TaxID=63155 RepID=UPI0011E9C8B0|nr:interleukin-31 receptor subunit alpha-like [Archocentrus centrarchus]
MAEDCWREITKSLVFLSVFQADPGEMFGHGFLTFSLLKCSSCASHSYYITFGLILVYYATLSLHTEAAPEKCKSNSISSKYGHCQLHPDGVHDLDCFKKHTSEFTCVWKPGKHTSKKMHTFVIQQIAKNRCNVYNNVTGLSLWSSIFSKYNVTVQVFENTESKNCTKAVFEGCPMNLERCGPPNNVTIRRHSGKLDMNVIWPQYDEKYVKSYSVRYKALGSLQWNEPAVESQNGTACRVENLNSSVVYIVQIHCVINNRCTQCPWSEPFIVPSELMSQPVIIDLSETDIADKRGSRLISITWKSSTKELHDGYIVTIGKESGEDPHERMYTTQPQIMLILSYSAYRVNISSFSNTSISPAVSRTIPQREDVQSLEDGGLRVKVHNKMSFTIYWNNDLIKKYVCYSAEWREERNKAAYVSFYLKGSKNKTFSSLAEPLKPHKRYTISLHVRPNKDTCNMKHINNSERTYGSTQFYLTEGPPVSAPANISSYNVTQNSMVLQWSPIPEEDTRGFLLGYTIHYAEYYHMGTDTEKNITVDPELDSYKLEDLKSSTAYQVQMSGFTSAGAGVRSASSIFKTHHEGSFHLSGIITVSAVMVILLLCGPPIIKRAKVVLWPSIPNPGISNAMQKINRPCELELLEAINTLKVEEWDTKSLHIVEKEAVPPANILPSILPLLCGLDNERDSPEMTSNWIQRETGDAAGDLSSDITTDRQLETQQTDRQSFPFAFPSGYTTMEMLQQVMPQGSTAVIQDMESEPEDTDFTVLNPRPGLDYVRQFSTSPVSDSDHLSTILL